MSAAPDKPQDVLESFATLLLQVQPDKWSEFVGSKEATAMLDEFFQQQDTRELVLELNPAGQLQATTHFPATLRGKGIYFVKKEREPITPENCRSGLLVGDISPSPVEHLITILEEVVSPLLLSKKNQAGMTEVMVEEIVQQTQQLKKEMFVVSGKTQGKPQLLLPEHLDSSLAGPLDTSALHIIETIVIEWSHQIQDMLSKDLEQSLLEVPHPLPRMEFEFWHSRRLKLQCINDQLLSPRVVELAEVLEKRNSSYWAVLQSLFRDVSAGLEEAKDISVYLKPLQILLEEMEQADYSQLQPCVDRVLCALSLLRARCQYYSSPANVIILLQEICNLLITMTRAFLSTEDVMKGLQGETQKTLGRIRQSISTIENILQSYRTYSDLTHTLLPEEPELWEIYPSLFFGRLDSFLHRLKSIEELYQTAMEFRKLEKVELGGVIGEILRSKVFQIYEEFSELIKAFVDCKYDPLDLAEEQWNKDFAAFQNNIEDMDRRLATVFRQGFEDCSCLESALKLVHMFASLLERPLIRAEFSLCYSALLGMFHTGLKTVKALFDAPAASPPSHGVGQVIKKNMPPVSGQLAWALELQQQLEGPHRDLFAINHPVMASFEAKLVSREYEEMVRLLRGYGEKVYEEWVCGDGQSCHFSLEQPLILKDPSSSLLSVNFSEKLVAVMQEVKYLNFLQQKNIPGTAKSLFAQKESLQKFVDTLELLTGWYNEVKQTLLPVELSLVAEELEAVDEQLASAENTLFWHHEGVAEYIQETRERLYSLHTRVQRANLNMKTITQLMKECSDAPLFGRKDNNQTALLDLNGKANTLATRYTAINNTGVRIQEMLEENAHLFKADKSSQLWLDYVEYIDRIVLDGLSTLVRKSLELLLTNMAPDVGAAPLFEVRMELCDNKVQYNPSLNTQDDNSFLKLVQSLLRDIYAAAACMPRLLEGKLSYQTTLEEQAYLSKMQDKVVSLVVSTMMEGEEYSISFVEQVQEWLEDPEDFLQRFLTLDSSTSPEKLEPQPEEPLADGTLSLQLLQQEIDACETMCEKVSDFADTQVFGGWLQSDCRPVKQALLDAIKHRGLVLQQHLSSTM